MEMFYPNKLQEQFKDRETQDRLRINTHCSKKALYREKSLAKTKAILARRKFYSAGKRTYHNEFLQDGCSYRAEILHEPLFR